MKLRIRDDSIRLRLARAEVADIAAGRPVACRCRFPDGSILTYRLTPGDGAMPRATMDSGTLDLAWPAEPLLAWAGGDDVSLESSLPMDEGPLKLLVEKDFQCLTERPDEDESDLYPHPMADDGGCG